MMNKSNNYNSLHNYSQQNQNARYNPMNRKIDFPTNKQPKNTLTIFWKGVIINPTRKQLLTYRSRLDDIKRNIGYRSPPPPK